MPSYKYTDEQGQSFKLDTEEELGPQQVYQRFAEAGIAPQLESVPTPRPSSEEPGYLSQLGTALSIGGRQMAAGVKGTFNAATGDVPDTAEAMTRMAALGKEQQEAQTGEDVSLNEDFAKNKAEYEKAQGIWPTTKALAGYAGSIASHPGAAFKQAVQSAPNAVIGTGTSIAGYGLGAVLGAGAGTETGPGAILTGLAGATAGGAVSNSLMEAGPAIYDVLNERTNGAAANMTADQISEVLKKDPTIMSEGLKTGAIRGSVIGLIEGLGMKGAGALMTIPERAAARAAQKTLLEAGVDLASKEAVKKAMEDTALKQAVSSAVQAAKSQYSTAGNLARGAGGAAIETAAAGAGEIAAQKAAGQQIDPTAAVQEMMGEVGINAATAPAVKAYSATKSAFMPEEKGGINVSPNTLPTSAGLGRPVSEVIAEADALKAKAHQQAVESGSPLLAQAIAENVAAPTPVVQQAEETGTAELNSKQEPGAAGQTTEPLSDTEVKVATEQVSPVTPETDPVEIHRKRNAETESLIVRDAEGDVDRAATKAKRDAAAKEAGMTRDEWEDAQAALNVKAKEDFFNSLNEGDTLEWTDANGKPATGKVEIQLNGKKVVRNTTEGSAGQDYLYDSRAGEFGMRADSLKVIPKGRKASSPTDTTEAAAPLEQGGSNQHAGESVGVPLMVTRDMRQQLYDRGFSRADVDAMKPENAQRILASPLVSEKTPPSQDTYNVINNSTITTEAATPLEQGGSNQHAGESRTPAEGSISDVTTSKLADNKPLSTIDPAVQGVVTLQPEQLAVLTPNPAEIEQAIQDNQTPARESMDLSKADPIMVIRQKDGTLKVAQGHHRLARALRDNAPLRVDIQNEVSTKPLKSIPDRINESSLSPRTTYPTLVQDIKNLTGNTASKLQEVADALLPEPMTRPTAEKIARRLMEDNAVQREAGAARERALERELIGEEKAQRGDERPVSDDKAPVTQGDFVTWQDENGAMREGVLTKVSAGRGSLGEPMSEVTLEDSQVVQVPRRELQPLMASSRGNPVQASRAEAIESLRGHLGKEVSVGVSAVDAINGAAELQGDVPGVQKAWVGTSGEFLADEGLRKAFPQVNQAMTSPDSSRFEGLFSGGRAFVFTDNVGIYEGDIELAAQEGMPPGQAAVQRVITHEALVHRGFYALDKPTRQALLRWGEQNIYEGEMDAKAEEYGVGANWRSDVASREWLMEEIMAKMIERLKAPPKSGPLKQLWDIMASLWRKLTGRSREVTLKDIHDVAKLLRTALELAENNVQTRDGMPIKVEVVKPSMAGERANLPVFMQDSLDAAKAMAAAGKSSADIRAVTGWFPGKYDGKMRWEVPDKAAKFTDLNDRGVWVKNGNRGNSLQGTTLGKLLNHPQLFEAYPDLREVSTIVRFDPSVGESGVFRRSDPRAKGGASIQAQGGTQKSALSTLLHEVQHWIQEKEGFAQGNNPENALNNAKIEANRLTAYLQDKVDAAQEAWRNSTPGEDARLKAEFVKALEEQQAAYELGRQDPLALYRKYAGEIEARDVQARQSFTPEQRKAIEPYSSENIAKENAIVMKDGQPMFSIRPTYTSHLDQTLANTAKAVRLMRDGPPAVPVNLQEVYRKAQVGKSSAMVSLDDMFAEAKKAHPDLTEAEFGQQVQALYNDNGAFIEPADSPTVMREAGEKYNVRMLGVPASYVMVLSDVPVRASMRSEQDAEYMAAVESGDVAKQQAMVGDTYAKFVRNTVMLGDKFYPATFIRFGKPPTNAEGSQVRSTGFDGGVREKGVSVIGTWYDPVRGKYVIPTGSEQAVAGVSDLVLQNRPVFVVSGSVSEDMGSDTEPLMEPGTVSVEKNLSYSDLVEENNPDFTLDGGQYDSGEEGTKNTYTGGKERWWKSKGVPLPSLAPITRDADGNVIPLSQRFNTESNDIRFSLAPETASRLNRVVEAAQTASGDITESEQPQTQSPSGVNPVHTFTQQSGESHVDAAVQIFDAMESEGVPKEEWVDEITSPAVIRQLGIDNDMMSVLLAEAMRRGAPGAFDAYEVTRERAGRALGSGAMIHSHPRYQHLFVLNGIKKEHQQQANDIAEANADIKADEVKKLDAESGRTAAQELSESAEEAMFRAGEEALSKENKTLWQKAKDLITRIGASMQILAARKAKNGAETKPSVRGTITQADLDALNKMSDADLMASIEKDQKALREVLKGLTGTKSDGGATSRRVATLVNRLSEQLGVPTDITSAVEALTASQDSLKSQFEQSIVDSLVGKVRSAITPKKAPSKNLNSVIKQITRILADNLNLPKVTGPTESLGEKAIDAFGRVRNNEQLIREAWEKAREQIRATLAKRATEGLEGLTEEEAADIEQQLDDQLAAIAAEVPAHLWARGQAFSVLRDALAETAFDNNEKIMDNPEGALKAAQGKINEAVEKVGNVDPARWASNQPYIIAAFNQLVADLRAAKARSNARRRAAQRAGVFSPAETETFNRLMDSARKRSGDKTPLLPENISWGKLFSSSPQSQEAKAKSMMEYMKADPVLSNLTAAEQQELADMFAKQWEAKRAALTEAKVAAVLKRRHATEKGKEAVKGAIPKFIQAINRGELNNDIIAQDIAEKFGFQKLTDDENKKLETLAKELQQPDIPVHERRAKTDEIVKIIARKTGLSTAEILSAWWVTSVLSGPRTIFTIGMAFLSGGFEVFTHAMATVINAHLQGRRSEGTDAAMQSITNYFKSYPRAVQLAWQYVMTGDKNLLADSDPAFMQFFDTGRNNPQSIGWRMTQSKNPATRMLGRFMHFFEKMLTAGDLFNSTITRHGMLPVAMFLNSKTYDKARVASETDLASYRQEALNKWWGGEEPKSGHQQALVTRQSIDLIESKLAKYANVLEDANFVAAQGAMTLNPEGLGGKGYRAIRGIANRAETSSAKAVKNADKLKAEEVGALNKKTQQAIAFLYHFATHQMLNLGGLRFARFAGNKLNQSLGFVPLLGLARLYEKDYAGQIKSQAIIKNQVIGAVIAMVGITILKAVSDEPDDEKRGWGIEGSWAGLSADKIKQLMAAGLKQNSVHFWGHTFNYANWPISSVLAAFGAMADRIKYNPKDWKEATSPEVAYTGLWAAMTSTFDTTALSQLSEILGSNVHSRDPVDASIKKVSRVFGNFAGGFVPRVFKDADLLQDGKLRKYEGWENFAKEIPIYRRYVGGPLLDIFGKQVEVSRTPWSREYLAQPEAKEYRLLGQLGSNGLWLTPADPANRRVGRGKRSREMTDAEQKRFVTIVGNKYRDLVLKHGERLTKMPHENAKELMGKLSAAARDRAERAALVAPATQP